MSDALDGQAALDEANGEIARLRAKLAEAERVIDFQREEMRAAHERRMSEDEKVAKIHRLTAEVERLRANIEPCERCGADRLVSGTENPCPCTFAAGPWRTDDPPRDGTPILDARNGKPQLTCFGVNKEGVGVWFVTDRVFWVLPPVKWAEVRTEEPSDE